MINNPISDERLSVAKKLALVLPHSSDVGINPRRNTEIIQSKIRSLLDDSKIETDPEQTFDVPVAVRVSKRTAARIDYFAKKLGMSKANFIRQVLNERLTNLTLELYRADQLKDIEDELKSVNRTIPIMLARQLIQEEDKREQEYQEILAEQKEEHREHQEHLDSQNEEHQEHLDSQEEEYQEHLRARGESTS